jgi:hypothetical protein
MNGHPRSMALVTVEFGHPHYRPMRELLAETYERYRRPMFVAEAGAEGSARAAWLFKVCEEVRAWTRAYP